MSRAQKHLEVIHSYDQNFFSFINLKDLHRFFDVKKLRPLISSIPLELISRDVPVTNLISYLNTDIVENCLKNFCIREIKSKKSPIHIKNKCYNINDHNVEPVCDFNGIAIPAYFEVVLTKNSSILNRLQNTYIDYAVKNANDMMNIKTLLKVSMDYHALCNGYIGRQMQIDSLEWLSYQNLNDCLKRFKDLKIESSDIKFEANVQKSVKVRNNTFNLIGSVDCITQKDVYEFKAKGELDNIDFLQLLIYAFMNEDTECEDRKSQIKTQKKYYLYNVITDQMFQVCFTFDQLKELVILLLNEKYFKVDNILTDEEFILKNSSEPYMKTRS